MRRRRQHKSAVLAILILGVTFNTGCGPFLTAIIQLVTAAISLGGGGGGGGGGIGGMVGGAASAVQPRPLVANSAPVSPGVNGQGAAPKITEAGLGAFRGK